MCSPQDILLLSPWSIVALEELVIADIMKLPAVVRPETTKHEAPHYAVSSILLLPRLS